MLQGTKSSKRMVPIHLGGFLNILKTWSNDTCQTIKPGRRKNQGKEAPKNRQPCDDWSKGNKNVSIHFELDSVESGRRVSRAKRSGFQWSSWFQAKLEFIKHGFWGRGNLEYPQENLLKQTGKRWYRNRTRVIPIPIISPCAVLSSLSRTTQSNQWLIQRQQGLRFQTKTLFYLQDRKYTECDLILQTWSRFHLLIIIHTWWVLEAGLCS